MRRPCARPFCRDGVVPIVLRTRTEGRIVGHRRCPSCQGCGQTSDDDEDLRSAGIVVWDRSEEDFRSLPTHWRP